MKKALLPLIFLCLSAFAVSAQDNVGGTPPSIVISNLPNNIDIVQVQPPDLVQLAAEDRDHALKSEAYRVGVTLPVDFHLNNSGTWTELPGNASSLWRLTIRAEGAKAIGFQYGLFYMPEGAKLYLYNRNKSKIIGAFSSINNTSDYHFTNEQIEGDEITLELYVPNQKINATSLHITGLEYYYRGGENESVKSADTCEVNINCPEGANWQDEKKGVCKIKIQNGSDIFYCSGSLVNNTSQDCKPYVLLADHCHYYGGYPSASDYNAWVFYFHNEATTCAGTTASGTFSKVGCTLRAHDTYGQTTTGSDFCLVEITTAFTTAQNVYYNGWDRNNTTVSSGVGIHHPNADIMKISTFTTTLTNYSTHWGVVWAPTLTHHGVTEEGSSGSPLFNSSGYIIGTLTGGQSFCYDPYKMDVYGKVYYHWDKNGTTSAKRLKDWLDPTNNGATTLMGRAACYSGVSEINANEEKISIYPSPATNKILINTVSPVNKIEKIMIYNALGVLVKNIAELDMVTSEATIDISALAEGVYYITAQNGKTLFKGEFVKIK